MLNLKHIIFDWSGTLYDDHRPSFIGTKQTVKHFSGKNITYQEYKRYFEIPVDRFYRRYNKTTPIEEIDQYYFQTYERTIHKGKLFDGVLETLKILKQLKISVSILSTVRQDILEDMCERLNLTQYFCRIHGSAFDKNKAIRNHVKRLGYQNDEVLFIGDMEHDIEAAHFGKILSGAVASGYHQLDRLVMHGPRFVWEHQRDWVPFFQSLKSTLPKKKAKPYPVATSGALVVAPDQKVLLVLTPKWSYTYGIPGGKIEKGETGIQACVRELKEETGLDVCVSNVGEPLLQDCIDSEEFYIPNSHFLLLNYVAKTKKKTVRLNEEALSYLWIDPKVALNLKLNQPTRVLLESYLQPAQCSF